MSFSLVAGAVCIVKFANDLTYNHASTLNINSTGAKEFLPKLNDVPNSLYGTIIMYNGSVYRPPYNYYSYSDYTD